MWQIWAQKKQESYPILDDTLRYDGCYECDVVDENLFADTSA